MAYSAFSIKWHCSHLLFISTHKTGFLCAERWRRRVLAGRGVRKQPSEWWTFRRRKSQTLTTVAGSQEYGIVLQTLLGLRCFWISCPPPIFPLVLLLLALLLFFMISSLLKDTCCESLVLARGEWLTKQKSAFDVVRLDFIFYLFLTSFIWSQSSVAEIIWISVTNGKQVDDATENAFPSNAFLNKVFLFFLFIVFIL